MITELPASQRELKHQRLDADLAIVGGGLAGACCAIAAARAGIKVVLVQDRPVLGGNASSEVRLWILGATSHMGNNNRWAREGGITDEILVENMFRNREGNPVLFDTVLLDKVTAEPNITLLLNTAAFELAKRDADTIASVRAFCSQNSTMYDIHAPLFCDASGDGILGFLSGAAFRMGAESRQEFGEGFAPSKEYGELLGHTIYFYSKDTHRPVKFVPPSYALKDITRIPRFRSFTPKEHGCKLWWIEYGGRLDTVHQTETIKWELWKVVYGVWNHIKNSGQFPESANLTLEWVGTIPGKRESRRFEGDYMIIQQDVIEQRHHDDAVSFGGWSIDLHPADGVFSEKSGCNQWHSKGLYAIPYRAMYSRNIRNLFLAGRTISASHVAYGTTRVMATCGYNAQAVGMAAALCRRQNLLPRDLASKQHIGQLQLELMRTGQHIPGLVLSDPQDLARTARIDASSRLKLSTLPDGAPPLTLDSSWAMLLPVPAGPFPKVSLTIDAAQPTTLQLELRISSKPDNHTPDTTLATKCFNLPAGKNQPISLQFDAPIDQPRYAFVCLMANPHIAVHRSQQRLTGVLSVCNQVNLNVAKSSCQTPPSDIGVDTFEFWRPQRRPDGQNFAMTLHPAIDLFTPANLTNGLARPTRQPNAYVADITDPKPTVTLTWPKPQTLSRIELSFDTDWDHPMESVQWGHPEDIAPFCVRHYRILDANGTLLAERTDNHQTRNTIQLSKPTTTDKLIIELTPPGNNVPASLFEVRCYA